MTAPDQTKSKVAKLYPGFYMLSQDAYGEVGIFTNEADDIIDGVKKATKWKQWLNAEVKADIKLKKGVDIDATG